MRMTSSAVRRINALISAVAARAMLLVGNSLTVFRITRSPSGWTRSRVAGAVRSAAGGTPFPGAVSPKAAVATAAPLLKNYAGNFNLAPAMCRRAQRGFDHKADQRSLCLRKQDNEISEWLDEVAIEIVHDVFRHT